jgi:hypothetical protein
MVSAIRRRPPLSQLLALANMLPPKNNRNSPEGAAFSACYLTVHLTLFCFFVFISFVDHDACLAGPIL